MGDLQSIAYRLAFRSGGIPNLDDPGLGTFLACFSEIAYTPTSRYEVEGCRNAKVVPSSFFQEAVVRRSGINIVALLQELFPEAQPRVEIVETEYSVTVIARLARVVVIASRGTVPFYDGQNILFHDLDVDLLGAPVTHQLSFVDRWRFHRGFYYETLRTIDLIRAAYDGLGGASAIYFTGHSLGGALSAVTDRLWALRWPTDERHTVVFGCPRFGDRFAVDALPLVAYRRKRDPVPHLPPRFFAGFASPTRIVELNGPGRHALINLFANHSMERYRRSTAFRYDPAFDDEAFYQLLKARLMPLD